MSVDGSPFAALADATRRGLFERLCREGELSVAALTAQAGVSQPAVSKHLATLRRAGLVGATPRGREIRYRAEVAGLAPLADWTRRMTAIWEGRLDRLEDTLRRMDT